MLLTVEEVFKSGTGRCSCSILRKIVVQNPPFWCAVATTLSSSSMVSGSYSRLGLTSCVPDQLIKWPAPSASEALSSRALSLTAIVPSAAMIPAANAPGPQHIVNHLQGASSSYGSWTQRKTTERVEDPSKLMLPASSMQLEPSYRADLEQ